MTFFNKFYLLSFFAACMLLMNCNGVKDIEYVGIKETGLESMSLSNGVIKTVLTYYNPNKFGLDIKETNLEVYANDQYVGVAENAEKYNVPKSDTFDFPVYVHFNPIKMLSLAAANLNTEKVNLRVKGTAKIGKKGVFVRVPIDVTEKVSIR